MPAGQEIAKKAPDAESAASFTRVSGSCVDTETSMKSGAGNKTEQTELAKIIDYT